MKDVGIVAVAVIAAIHTGDNNWLWLLLLVIL